VEVHAVPQALRSRLGPEATSGVLARLELSQREAKDTMIEACTERLERRLVDEISKVRVDVAQLGAALRQEMAVGRVGLFKWCFLFWIGQVLAIAGLMAAMLRVLR
jgi:3-deoxy-D-arabino-heptulosonate 7-phosphate (DAHP) synthase